MARMEECRRLAHLYASLEEDNKITHPLPRIRLIAGHWLLAPFPLSASLRDVGLSQTGPLCRPTNQGSERCEV